MNLFRNSKGLSLVSVMVSLFILSLFSLLLAQVIAMSRRDLSFGIGRNNYEQIQGQIQFAAHSAGVIKESLAYTLGASRFEKLVKCFEGRALDFDCSTFQTLTATAIELKSGQDSLLNKTQWGSNGKCDSPNDCLFETSTTFTLSCMKTKCFSVSLGLYTLKKGSRWTDQQRHQFGIPASDLNGRIRKATVLASQFTQIVSMNPEDPKCGNDVLGYVGLDFGNNGFLCGSAPANSVCLASLRHLLTNECVWSPVGRSGSGARGSFEVSSLQIAQNCNPSVSMPVHLESFGELTQSNYNANDPAHPTFVTTPFFIAGEDRLAFACPGLFSGTRDSFDSATAQTSIELDVSNCPTNIFRKFECSVFVKNAAGLTKGTIGSFAVTLMPIPNPGDGGPGSGGPGSGGPGSGGPGSAPPVDPSVPSGSI